MSFILAGRPKPSCQHWKLTEVNACKLFGHWVRSHSLMGMLLICYVWLSGLI